MFIKSIAFVVAAAQVLPGSPFTTTHQHLASSPRGSPLFAGLNDRSTLETSQGKPFQDGTDPSSLGVSNYKNYASLPEGIAKTGAEFRIFSLAEGEKVTKHKHQGAQINFVLRGSETVTTNGWSKTFKPGDIYCIPSGVEYEVEAGEVGALWGHTWYFTDDPDMSYTEIIDLGNVKRSEGTPLYDGTSPQDMGVTRAFDVELPKELSNLGEIKIFEFDKGGKVGSHAHTGEGLYFVVEGSLTVTTSNEKRTYEKGDFVIVDKEVEYGLEAGELTQLGYIHVHLWN